MDPFALINSIPEPLSYALFGALGGLLYVARQKLKGYRVMPRCLVIRPAFGAVSAYSLTVLLHLPNHFTSLFAGYFGVDIWDALSAIAVRTGKLPLADTHILVDEVVKDAAAEAERLVPSAAPIIAAAEPVAEKVLDESAADAAAPPQKP